MSAAEWQTDIQHSGALFDLLGLLWSCLRILLVHEKPLHQPVKDRKTVCFKQPCVIPDNNMCSEEAFESVRKHWTANTYFDLPTALSPRQMIFTCSSVSYFFWSSSERLLTSPAICFFSFLSFNTSRFDRDVLGQGKPHTVNEKLRRKYP